MDEKTVPHHVAIIADGNRRFAKEKGLPSFEGHRRGFENIKLLSREGKKLGIRIMTFWIFSTENWDRDAEEVAYLMKLGERVIDSQIEEAIQNKTRIVHIGRKDRIPNVLRQKIENAEQKTKEFSEYYFVVALDYGGRDEIMRAVQRANTQNRGDRPLDDFLDTRILPYPNPDLIIRTGGEQRMSGFMTWQSAYSEYYFAPEMFPVFGPHEFRLAIEAYTNRKRRFGK